MNGQNRVTYLIRRMFYRYFSDSIPQAAAELAYFLLFSIFPLLMFLNSLLAQLDISVESVQTALTMLPQSVQQLITGYLIYIAGQSAISPMIIGAVLSLYFISRAVRSMMRTANAIYHIEVQRSASLHVAISFLIAAGFLLSIGLSFVLFVIGRTVLRILPQYVPIPAAVLAHTQNATFWVMIAFLFGFLLLFNKVVPNLELAFRDVWPGALFSLVCWISLSFGFSFYVDHMAHYSLLYGSIGAIIVLMLWLYLVSMILLMGVQLNHILMVMRQYRLETGRKGTR